MSTANSTIQPQPIFHIDSHRDQSNPEPELTLDEIMSRVAEIRSRWGERERYRRKISGIQRREQLLSLVCKCA